MNFLRTKHSYSPEEPKMINPCLLTQKPDESLEAFIDRLRDAAYSPSDGYNSLAGESVIRSASLKVKNRTFSLERLAGIWKADN